MVDLAIGARALSLILAILVVADGPGTISAEARTRTGHMPASHQRRQSFPPRPVRTVRVAVDDRAECAPTEGRRLTLREGNRDIAFRQFCSASALGQARLVNDTAGRTYVLLTYNEGRGTHVTSVYLNVYEVDHDFLAERARFLIQDPNGTAGEMVFDYRVATPRGGGITLSGRWRLEGPREPDFPPPNWARSVFEFDTAPQR